MSVPYANLKNEYSVVVIGCFKINGPLYRIIDILFKFYMLIDFLLLSIIKSVDVLNRNCEFVCAFSFVKFLLHIF